MATVLLDLEDLVTTTEGAAEAQVHINTLRNWLNAGAIAPVVTIKGIRLLSRRELVRLAAEKRARQVPQAEEVQV